MVQINYRTVFNYSSYGIRRYSMTILNFQIYKCNAIMNSPHSGLNIFCFNLNKDLFVTFIDISCQDFKKSTIIKIKESNPTV